MALFNLHGNPRDAALSLPFGTTVFYSRYGIDSICVGETGIANLIPAGIGPPEIHRSGSIETCTEVVGRINGHPVHLWRVVTTWLLVRNHGAVIIGMIFQHDVRDIDICRSRSTAEVKDEFYRREVFALDVAHPEHIFLSCLQAHVVHVDDGIGIGLVSQLDGNSIDVLVGHEDAGEVIVVGGRDTQVGVQVHLSLPAVGTGIRHSDSIVVATILIGCLHLSGAHITPPRLEVERGFRCDAFPQVEVATGIEAALLHVAHIGLAGQNETPGYGTVGSLIDEHHLLGGQ